MRVLVANSGSSSAKLCVFDLDETGRRNAEGHGALLVQGAVRGIGGMASLELKAGSSPGVSVQQAVADDRHAIRWLFDQWADSAGLSGGADAIVFGGGIGEAAPAVRNGICEGMAWCGLVLDADSNTMATGLAPGQAARIRADRAAVSAYVVAADQESWIARETGKYLRARRPET